MCVAYGSDYFSAALSVQRAYNESLSVLQNKDSRSMILYLMSSDAASEDSNEGEGIVLTTVHKAKGKEFENVVYVPSKTRDRSDFQDKIVEAILKTKGVSAKEELEEESLRIDFVAFTRARKNLVVVADKVQDYFNDFAELKEFDVKAETWSGVYENQKKAYGLFVNGQMKEAKRLLEGGEFWVKDFIRSHFKSLDHVSFSSAPKDAYGYFVEKMLIVSSFSRSISRGSEVHDVAEKLLKGEEVEPGEELKPYADNTRVLINQIKRSHPSAESEKKVRVPLRKMGFDSELTFEGKIDAVFKNGSGEHLIVDWKTSKKESSSYGQQLSTYKKAFCLSEGIPEDLVKVAVGYVGLKSAIGGGEVCGKLDLKQPLPRSFEAVSKKIGKLVSWQENPELFFREFLCERRDDFLWRSVAEQLRREK